MFMRFAKLTCDGKLAANHKSPTKPHAIGQITSLETANASNKLKHHGQLLMLTAQVGLMQQP